MIVRLGDGTESVKEFVNTVTVQFLALFGTENAVFFPLLCV